MYPKKILEDAPKGAREDHTTWTSVGSHSTELFSMSKVRDSLRSRMTNAINNYVSQLEESLEKFEDAASSTSFTSSLKRKLPKPRASDAQLQLLSRQLRLDCLVRNLSGCGTFMSLLSNDSDSEYTDAVEGEYSEYGVPGEVSSSNGNQRNSDAALAGHVEAALYCGETRALTTRTDQPQLHGETEDEGTGSSGTQSGESTGSVIGQWESATEENLELNRNSTGPTRLDDEAENNTPIVNCAQNVQIFLDGKIYRKRIRLDEDSWNATKTATLINTGTKLADKVKGTLQSGVTNPTTGHQDKLLQHGSDDEVETDIPTGTNGNQTKKGEFITQLSSCLDINEQGTGSAESSTDSSHNSMPSFDSKGPPRMMLHGQSDPSLWESIIDPISSTSHNKTENDGQTADNRTTNEKTIAKETNLTRGMASPTTLDVAKASTQDHFIANIVTNQTPVVQVSTLKTCSESRVPNVGQAVKKTLGTEITGSAVAVTASAPSLGNFKSEPKSFPKEDEILKSPTSTTTDDSPGCSKWVQRSSECGGNENVDQSLQSSSKLKNIMEQTGCSNVVTPLPFELHGLDSKSRDTVLSRFSSYVAFSNSSLSEGTAETDTSIEEMSDPSKCGTRTQGKDGGKEAAEKEEVKAETNESSVGDYLQESDSILLDDGMNTNNIAMMALVPSVSSETNEDAKKPTDISSSEIDGSHQSADLVSNEKIHHSSNENQAKEVTQSATNQIDGPADSSQGLQTLAQPDKTISGSQQMSNSGKSNARGKKRTRDMSKSLEDIIYASIPHKKVTHNLRKRPQPSLSGPTVVGCRRETEGMSNKRPRVSSPGMPPPAPFRVPDASPATLARSRHRQVSGLALLQSSNQVEGANSPTSRKRPNDDDDSNQDEPPAKKARGLDRNSPKQSEAGSSRQLGEVVPRSEPPSRSAGSGSSPVSLTLTKTPTITIKTASHDSSRSSDTGPRYNLRRRSAKIETEPVKIREVRNTKPETVIRARTVPRVLPGLPPTRTNRDRSQNTRPVIIEDTNRSKSKTNGRKPPDTDRRPKP